MTFTPGLSYRNGGASLPSLECSSDKDCDSYNASVPLVCIDEQCTCPAPYCWHYQYFNSKNFFFCGTCGTLGSSCNNTECKPPGRCWEDHFCHCNTGMNYYGICQFTVAVFEQTVVTSILTGIVFFLCIAICVVSFRPDDGYSRTWCCRRMPCNSRNNLELERDMAAIRRARRGRHSKTVAFTHTERLSRQANTPTVQ
ncbi:uncharacterized protein LOC108671742 isoform X2 [Hyalella azteca]|uniref:Uncharacterized protein LOC108671742 isoform X2 n=1 Tax=Hyalella azteca TaxID=294128 RepID=A0A8B7NMA0_HYAAZ|nr:uncharacterized protein LOC108671742 isoform X2 [Hyalella azteca]